MVLGLLAGLSPTHHKAKKNKGIALHTSQIVGTPNTRWTIPILLFRKANMDCEHVSLIRFFFYI